MADSLPATALNPTRFAAGFSCLLETVELQSPRFLVALSGGADSVALLRLLAATVPLENIRACYVDHQLQAHSGVWRDFCKTLCQSLGVDFVAAVISLEPERVQHQGLEATARDCRYQALLGVQFANEVLLTAHHQDDQLETLLFRLERGAGVKGLTGIPAVSRREHQGQSCWLMRPLLNSRKAELTQYLQQLQQTWIEDPSNQELNYRRNYYRQQVVPAISKELGDKVLQLYMNANEVNRLLKSPTDEWLKQRLHSVGLAHKLTLLEQDFAEPELLRYRVDGWLKSQLFSIDSKKLTEVLRQLALGKAVGCAPSFSRGGRNLWLKRRSLWLG